MSALRFISETTATSTSSLSVTDVFTSDFSVYKVELIRPDLNTGTGTYVDFRFVTSDGIVVSTDYGYGIEVMNSNAGFGSDKNANESFMRGFRYSSNSSADGGGMVLWIFEPTNTSTYTFARVQAGSYSTAESKNVSTKGIGVLQTTDSIGGINFFHTNNFDSIHVKVYGLRQ